MSGYPALPCLVYVKQHRKAGIAVVKVMVKDAPDEPDPLPPVRCVIVAYPDRTYDVQEASCLHFYPDDQDSRSIGFRDTVADYFEGRCARLRAIEGLKDVPDNFTFGDVWVDLRRRILLRGSDPEYRLTTHEAGVLGYLIAHRGRDVTREELLEKVWGYAPTMQTRTVDNQILKLRKKVEEEPADPRHILTIHGKGYRFEE